MGLGVGIFLIAVGAILTFAVNASTSGVNIDAVGVILIVVGLVAILLDLVLWSSWGPGIARRRRYVAEGPAPAYEERRYVEARPARRVRTVEEEDAAGPPPP